MVKCGYFLSSCSPQDRTRQEEPEGHGGDLKEGVSGADRVLLQAQQPVGVEHRRK